MGDGHGDGDIRGGCIGDLHSGYPVGILVDDHVSDPVLGELISGVGRPSVQGLLRTDVVEVGGCGGLHGHAEVVQLAGGGTDEIQLVVSEVGGTEVLDDSPRVVVDGLGEGEVRLLPVRADDQVGHLVQVQTAVVDVYPQELGADDVGGDVGVSLDDETGGLPFGVDEVSLAGRGPPVEHVSVVGGEADVELFAEVHGGGGEPVTLVVGGIDDTVGRGSDGDGVGDTGPGRVELDGVHLAVTRETQIVRFGDAVYLGERAAHAVLHHVGIVVGGVFVVRLIGLDGQVDLGTCGIAYLRSLEDPVVVIVLVYVPTLQGPSVTGGTVHLDDHPVDLLGLF